MNYNSLHTLSGILIFISISCKIILHYYLDYKHYRSISFIYSFITPLPYFHKYNKTVHNRFLKIKRLCNLFLYLTIVFLILNIIIGVILYFKK
jgi:hypothetical protein